VPAFPRIAAATAALALMVAGCTPVLAPVRTPEPGTQVTQPTVPPAASSATSGGVPGIDISPIPGTAIDRPTYPDSNARPQGFAEAPTGEGLTGYLAQTIEWVNCGDGRECADILVPLDYAEPGQQAITLSLKRLPATSTPKLGSLFLNPGGPGGPGKDMADSFDNEGLEAYDLIGWDPRGAGDSTPVACFGTAETDAFNELDFSPDDDDERAALITGAAEFARACWETSGDLLNHISTIETVRDLDLMRQLVGDPTLSYLGYSYGTAIGATYAELFPATAGRLVLDAAVDITDDEEIIQAMGFDLSLGNFAAWCGASDCDLGTSKRAVLDTIIGFFDELDAEPITVGQRRLTQSLAVIGVAAFLYGGEPAWPALVASIRAAMMGNGRGLLYGADLLNSRNERGTYDTMFYAFQAISCLDATDDGIVDADDLWADDQKKAPIFGLYFGPQYLCPLWPTRPAPQLDIQGAGAAPILVIGATGDSATPYQQAVTMAKQLDSGVLVTWEGEGHGTYGGKSACVDRIVVDFLTEGTVPEDGTRCR